MTGEVPVPGAAVSEDKRTLTFSVQKSQTPVQVIVSAGLSLIPQPHLLTVNSGSGSGSYEKGTVVAISADEPAAGWRFTGWTVTGDGVIADAGASRTSFTMADR